MNLPAMQANIALESGAIGILAGGVWMALLLGIISLLILVRQLREQRQTNRELARPHLVMVMEPNAGHWHLVDLVIRNEGQHTAHDVTFDFAVAPSVARYERMLDGKPVATVTLPLPELPSFHPGQEWRTVWDSVHSRRELGDVIRPRYDGSLTYHDRPTPKRQLGLSQRRLTYTTEVVLDWTAIEPGGQLNFISDRPPSRRDRQARALLRSLLTYYRFATRETRPEAYQFEIERIDGVTLELLGRQASNSAHNGPPSMTLEDATSTVPVPEAAGDHDSHDTNPPTDVITPILQTTRRRGRRQRRAKDPSGKDIRQSPPDPTAPEAPAPAPSLGSAEGEAAEPTAPRGRHREGGTGAG